MIDNQRYGLTIKQQAEALAVLCSESVTCPAIMLDPKYCSCPLGDMDCEDVLQKHWIAVLEKLECKVSMEESCPKN